MHRESTTGFVALALASSIPVLVFLVLLATLFHISGNVGSRIFQAQWLHRYRRMMIMSRHLLDIFSS